MVGADLSAVLAALRAGAPPTGFSAPFVAFATGLSAIGLSESFSLMLKFYRDIVGCACLPRTSALH
jgi:hypothetical protein